MTRVRINTDLVHTAAKHVAAAQNGTGRAWTTLAGALTDSKGMAGNPVKDQAAARFVAAYDSAVQVAWRAFGAMHASTGDMSRGLTQTANNHAKADRASRIDGGFSMVPRQGSFLDQLMGFQVSGPLTVPAPPSAAGPGKSPPQSLLRKLTGIEIVDISDHWPTADSTALAGAAQAWRSAHDALIGIRGRLVTEVRSVTDQGDAPDLDAFGGYWARLYRPRTPRTLYEGLPELCAGISKACADYSFAVMKAQIQFGDAAANPIAAVVEVAAMRAALAQAAARLLQAVSVIAVGALGEHLISSVTIGAAHVPRLRVLEAATENEGEKKGEDEGGLSERDVHGAGRTAERGVDEDYVWENGELYIQSDGQLVRVLDNGNGTYDVVIRDPSNPSGQSTTVLKGATERYLQTKIDKGLWQ
ncbi:hypothetical protein E1298_02185 [Actinomadura rubrisoli]|uniref:WXG100 family type VII secretion target n=2 Tax=Actinomadura rubrisoli TaxID=2530368 RepID=A0A4R5CEL7_9ACTN|nr:hypothetical protein E1298_02185 [Actinomadura rubrisoli]